MAEHLGVCFQAPERRDDAREHARSIAVPARRDGLRHLGQGLRVLVAADGRHVLPARLKVDVALGEDLRLQFEQALPETLAGCHDDASIINLMA